MTMGDELELLNWIQPEDDIASPFKCAETTPDCAEVIEPGNRIFGSTGDAKSKILWVERGRVKLSGPHGQWTLLPAHMVFLPYRRPYRLCTSSDSVVIVVHLNGDQIPWQHEGCWTAPVNTLAREMLGYSLRWNRNREAEDELANSYLSTIGLLCQDWFECSRMMYMPLGESAMIKRAVAYTRSSLAQATIELAAEAAGTSSRTLRRYFQKELGMSWRGFLQELRMTHAIELLTRKRMSITETALEVGFNSGAAFTLAFVTYTGTTPSAYARNFQRTE
jgi:AraC-like DNA-binding protein